MTEDSNTRKNKHKNLLQRLGIAAGGGVIGAFLAFNSIYDDGVSIQEFLIEQNIILLPAALLSLPAALIKRRTVNFTIALLVGVIVSLAMSFLLLTGLAAIVCGGGTC